MRCAWTRGGWGHLSMNDSYDSCRRQVREEIAKLLAGVVKEIDNHRNSAEAIGPNLEHAAPNPATLAYTDFLIGVAKSDKVEILFAGC